VPEPQPRTKTLSASQWRTCIDCLTRMAPGSVYVHDPRRVYGELERTYCVSCAQSRGLLEMNA
jgi:hypothetical protein